MNEKIESMLKELYEECDKQDVSLVALESSLSEDK